MRKADSALGWSKKRTIHTQECFRILKNTSVSLGEHIQNVNLSKYMLKLKMAGYSTTFSKKLSEAPKMHSKFG